MEAASDKDQPIFIVGMPRSGTTLMSIMFSAHPDVAISWKTAFLSHWTRAYRHLDMNRDEDFEIFWNAFIEGSEFATLGIDSESVKTQILAEPERDYRTVFTSILQSYAAKMKKRRWGEKTAEHYRYLHVILDWYPRARIIYMLRDPRSVSASLLGVPWDNRGVYDHAIEWRDNVQIAKQWTEDEHVRVVKYESLVADPEKELRSLCIFLGVEYDPAMLSPSRKTSPILNRGGWEKEFLTSVFRPVSTDSVKKWDSSLTSSQVAIIEHVARNGMLEYGYRPTTKGLSPAQWFRLIMVRCKNTAGWRLRNLKRNIFRFFPTH